MRLRCLMPLAGQLKAYRRANKTSSRENDNANRTELRHRSGAVIDGVKTQSTATTIQNRLSKLKDPTTMTQAERFKTATTIIHVREFKTDCIALQNLDARAMVGSWISNQRTHVDPGAVAGAMERVSTCRCAQGSSLSEKKTTDENRTIATASVLSCYLLKD